MARTKRKYGAPVGLEAAPIDVGALAFAGIRAGVDDARVDAAAKAGVLRGGSAGLVLDDGRVGSGCVRAAHARFLGAEPERDAEWDSRQLMFEAGHTNEDSWFANVSRALTDTLPGWRLLREEEFPIEWEIEGVRGTGREDLVLVDDAGVPRQLVELKLVSSLGTALEVLAAATPKMDHLVQLANYMYRSGLPGQLWYANRFDIPVPQWKWVTEKLPRSPSDTEHPAASRLEWSKVYGSKPANPTKIKQFLVGFDVAFDEAGVAWFREVGSPAEWTRSVVSKRGLDAFYSRVVRLPVDGLGDRPAVIEPSGKAGGYAKCNYCDWADVCSEVDAATGDPRERYDIFSSIVKQFVHTKKEK